jgi:hypothetical protein
MSPNAWRTTTLTLALALGAAASPALAHHAFATFDQQKSVTLQGDVKEFQWTNPHIWIQLVVQDPKGEHQEWSIEGASATVLSRQGWSRKTLKPGDRLVVVVHPSKQGTADGSLVSATLNGQPIGLPS